MINANQYNTTTETVSSAIRQSIQQNETIVVGAKGNRRIAIETELLAECEDSDGDGDYWGTSVGGSEWRVRVIAG